MTLHDIATQLHNLTDGRINGEHFTKHELESNLRRWMRHSELNKLAGRLVIEISLPDGKWLATVDQHSDGADGYDYFIPDTREQESILWTQLSR